ncbi:unnamed protein product [Prunus brigantina]
MGWKVRLTVQYLMGVSKITKKNNKGKLGNSNDFFFFLLGLNTELGLLITYQAQKEVQTMVVKHACVPSHSH